MAETSLAGEIGVTTSISYPQARLLTAPALETRAYMAAQYGLGHCYFTRLWIGSASE